jgi:hypothetical protein
LYANFQQTFVGLTVIVAVPLPVEVVCRYLPVKVARRTTSVLMAAGAEPAAARQAIKTVAPRIIGRSSTDRIRMSIRARCGRELVEMSTRLTFTVPTRPSSSVIVACSVSSRVLVNGPPALGHSGRVRGRTCGVALFGMSRDASRCACGLCWNSWLAGVEDRGRKNGPTAWLSRSRQSQRL